MRIAKEWASMAPRFHSYVKHDMPTLRSIGGIMSAAEFVGATRRGLRKSLAYGTKPTIYPLMFPNARDPFSPGGFQLSLDDIMAYEKKLPGWQVANHRGTKFPKVGAKLLCLLVSWTIMSEGTYYIYGSDLETFQEFLYGKVVVKLSWFGNVFDGNFDEAPLTDEEVYS